MANAMDDPINELRSLPGTLPLMGSQGEDSAPPDESMADIDPMERPIWEIDEDFINPYKELPSLQTWSMMGNRPALPKDGIVTFSAKQKKGKSLSTYALAIPLLSGKDFDTVHPSECPRMILVFDMEMGEATLVNRVKRQVEAIGEAGPRFLVCNLKGKSIKECMDKIRSKVKQYNPPIVVIDQAAKLVVNVNDPTETNGITNLLDQLSIGRAVWVVMHENKGSDDNNMRGHLGSYLSYAAVEAYRVDRKNGVFTITPKEARDTDTEDAAPVRFTLSGNGEIIAPDQKLAENREKEADRWRKDFSLTFGNDEELSYTELTTRVMKQLNEDGKNGKGKRTAQDKIGKARECGAIYKTDPNNRNSPYRLSSGPDVFSIIDPF